MGYKRAHAPIYGYMKGNKHTVPLHLVHYSRTFSIFKLLNRLQLGKVLNVGGADGYQSYLLQKILGADVTTMDINEDALNIAANYYDLKTKVGNALDLPFADNSFDTVLCIETIEHIKDSQRVVSELKRVSKNNVIISTESFFDNEGQKDSFLLYLHETHPQFFKNENPAQLSDISYFTIEDFYRLFDTDELSFYPQFSHKQTDWPDSIDKIRAHVKAMTENLTPDKQTKIIVHYHANQPPATEGLVPEEALLEKIVQDKPTFPMELDDEMIQEDAETLARLTKWHSDKTRCKVVQTNEISSLSIEDGDSVGVSLQWLTADDNERSPQFCTRKITLAANGQTATRKTEWEHQLYFLSGNGWLMEEAQKTAVQPGTTVFVKKGLSFKIVNGGDCNLEYLDIIPSITNFFGR